MKDTFLKIINERLASEKDKLDKMDLTYSSTTHGQWMHQNGKVKALLDLWLYVNEKMKGDCYDK